MTDYNYRYDSDSITTNSTDSITTNDVVNTTGNIFIDNIYTPSSYPYTFEIHPEADNNVKNMVMMGDEIFQLKEYIIEGIKNSIRWDLVSKNEELIKHSNFIEKYKNKLDWLYISQYQALSESFIEKYKNKVDWEYISKFQTLSYSFIIKYKDYLDWKIIKKKYNITYIDICKRINFENNKINLNI